MASTMLSDSKDATQNADWARNLLRETVRQRRALRMAQISPLYSNVRAPRTADTSISQSHEQRNHQSDRYYVASRVAAARLASIMSASVDTTIGTAAPGAREGTLELPAPPPSTMAVIPAETTTVAAGPQVMVKTLDTANLCPEQYLLHLLRSRGRAGFKVSCAEAGYNTPPTSRQIRDYESKPFMTDLVRRGDVDGLREALQGGRGMDASNKFGESLVHVACRRGNMDVLRFLLRHGGSFTCCDDLGRFPLHEVCWAVEPRFDIVRLFLEQHQQHQQHQNVHHDDNQTTQRQEHDRKQRKMREEQGAGEASAEINASAQGARAGDSNTGASGNGATASAHRGPTTTSPALDPNLLLVSDRRGCTPLRYVKEPSWAVWRLFLDEVADEFWPSVVPNDEGSGSGAVDVADGDAAGGKSGGRARPRA